MTRSRTPPVDVHAHFVTTPFPDQVPALVDAFGSDRVLDGSDYCWTLAAGVTA